ncbi:19537_t:CDS:2, partial [Gigaspora rosea]
GLELAYHQVSAELHEAAPKLNGLREILFRFKSVARNIFVVKQTPFSKSSTSHIG